MRAVAFIGLGSNLGERERYLEAALDRLRASPGVRVLAVSSVRETEPVGYAEQGRFLNAAAKLETTLRPSELLQLLLAIEGELGRVRDGPRFGPRTLDLDLLLYGDEQLEEPELTIPHPRLAERSFVLEPLAELEPGLEIPGRGPVESLLAALQ